MLVTLGPCCQRATQASSQGTPPYFSAEELLSHCHPHLPSPHPCSQTEPAHSDGPAHSLRGAHSLGPISAVLSAQWGWPALSWATAWRPQPRPCSRGAMEGTTGLPWSCPAYYRLQAQHPVRTTLGDAPTGQEWGSCPAVPVSSSYPRALTGTRCQCKRKPQAPPAASTSLGVRWTHGRADRTQHFLTHTPAASVPCTLILDDTHYCARHPCTASWALVRRPAEVPTPVQMRGVQHSLL